MSLHDERILYSNLSKKRKEISQENPIYLYQKDFSEGTYLIDKPGYYVLKENIVFNPIDYMPREDQKQYVTSGFSLGFFAIIAIYSKNVYLDLNGFSLSASEAFTLQQRFFSIIEFGNSPFIPKEGPGNFSTTESFQSAENVIVGNGKLGRSSHHGIHGNLASSILIENLIIEDFEFVGIALNGGNNILAHKVKIKRNRRNIPVLATYSAGRFARMFAKRLLSKYTLSEEQRNELTKRLKNLENEMNTTFNEVMSHKRVTSDLFRNDSGLADGNVYGFLVKDKGVAVNDFVTSSDNKTENVFLRKVKIGKLKCRVDEIIALSGKEGKGAQNDVAGAVLQIDNIKDEDGIYKGTVLSDLQLYLAELAVVLNIQLGKNNITSETIEWSKSGENISTLLEKGYEYKCGGDSMFHFGKSCLSYRFDAVNNLVLEKCSFKKIKNYGRLGNDKAAGNYSRSHDEAKRDGYHGTNVTGINLSCCSNVLLKKIFGYGLFSKNGEAIGLNVIFNSENVKIDEMSFKNIKAGKLYRGKWEGDSYSGKYISYTGNAPNFVPIAIGIRTEKKSIVDMKDVHICDLKSCAEPIKILKI
jgi:hypothetical protein